MTVRELIEALRALPPDMDVTTWDAEQDEYIPVTGAIYEEGHTTVDLLTGSALLPTE